MLNLVQPRMFSLFPITLGVIVVVIPVNIDKY